MADDLFSVIELVNVEVKLIDSPSIGTVR